MGLSTEKNRGLLCLVWDAGKSGTCADRRSGNDSSRGHTEVDLALPVPLH